MKTITHRCAAWIACFAMLFAALAPSVSHAMSASRSDAWTEICSAAGIKMVKVTTAAEAPGSPSTEKSPVNLEHCTFCATHCTAPGLLPASALKLPPVAGRRTHPSLFFQSPSPLAIWTPAQSRAPPA